MRQGIPPVGRDLFMWANDLRRWLARAMDSLTFKQAGAGAVAEQDGVLLWDAANGYPVVSKGGVWRQVLLADGYAIFSQDVDVTAAAANTAYTVVLSTTAGSLGGAAPVADLPAGWMNTGTVSDSGICDQAMGWPSGLKAVSTTPRVSTMSMW